MKIEKLSRTIQPRKGRKGKERPGLVSIIKKTSESWEDFKEISSGWTEPTERLQNLIDFANQFLGDLPSGNREYVIHPNGEWQYIPKELESLTFDERLPVWAKEYPDTKLHQGLSASSPLIEPASPEYYAVKARFSAEQALLAMENNNLALAVSNAMDATYYCEKIIFADQFEHLVLAALASTGNTKGKTINTWASQLAEYLRAGHGSNFKEAWNQLEREASAPPYLNFGDYEIEVNTTTNIITATSETTSNTQTMKMTTFSKKHYTKAK
jgi:hypothetical protein